MNAFNILNEWKNRPCVLATMHNKDRVISPLLLRELGITATVPVNFNTDQFGTFTREIKRAGNQLEAARNKALAAMELIGVDLGIASEGSFGAHPAMPFISSNLEIVVLIDKRNDLEIIGHYRSSDVCVHGQAVKTPEEAKNIACSWGFPDQGVIVRLSEKNNRHIYKDIKTLDELDAVSTRLLSKWFVKSIFIETDMRAHRCPKRMESIRMATLDLIKNCKSTCPKCAAPGFVITDTVKGLLCSHCNLPTDLVKETIYSCQKCNYKENKPAIDTTYAEPGDCEWCNP
ncbi:hypothetical protein K2P47_00650 [Patescibacteria group bacterium]|nr:hypothetical protein [Patescibacteria group bacterium]